MSIQPIRLFGDPVLVTAASPVVDFDKELRKLPVIMITTTDQPDEVDLCHDLGCNNYLVKPIDYDKFVDAITQLGLFLKIIQVPDLFKTK